MKRIPEIMTERLIIGVFKNEYLSPFLAFMLDDNSTNYLMFTEEQRTKKGATELLNYIIGSYISEEPIYSLAITNLNGAYVGSCGFSPIEKDVICECYYSINKEYRGNGYAIEAIDALIAYLFQHTSYREIRAYTHPENSYSSHVAQSVRMKNRGIQLHPIFNNEGLMYNIIKG